MQHSTRRRLAWLSLLLATQLLGACCAVPWYGSRQGGHRYSQPPGGEHAPRPPGR